MTPTPARPLAHSENDFGECEELQVHLRRVADYAKRFGVLLGCESELGFAALLHDIGKLGPEFTERLRGRLRGVDHWTLGAWIASEKAQKMCVPTVLACLGHHAGIPSVADMKSTLCCSPEAFAQKLQAAGRALSRVTGEATADWLEAHELPLPSLEQSCCPWEWFQSKGRDCANQQHVRHCANQLDVRMFFSALVDADFLATEGHFKAGRKGEMYVRPAAPSLQAGRALKCLLDAVEKRRIELSGGHPENHIPNTLMSLRQDLLDAALAKAGKEPGLFTLTAPTGSGKTFAMLAFALKHMARHKLRGRVVLILPYLSIIEQTADICRGVFGSEFPEAWMLEHHSLANSVRFSEDEQDPAEIRRRMLSENWDAPLILTTSVQFFESLFGNRPGQCRKLHRLAESVILFDEVQTLPPGLAPETLATLSRLAEKYRTSVVFSTATQPAFGHLDPVVRSLSPSGWKPREIVPNRLDLFRRARRTRVRWPEKGQTVSWPELAGSLARHEQVLCIVNLKRHASRLLEELRACGVTDCLHLSTNLCAAHREAVLCAVRERLQCGAPCRLVSTQCVEAGVDLDFASVYRAFGPLDAIAQAAGRCNRNGRNDVSEVVVFRPESEGGGRSLYPPGGYRQGAEVLEGMLAEGDVDIHDPAVYARYYGRLYSVAGLDRAQTRSKLREAVLRDDFPEIAQYYRLICRRTVNVLVPYDPEQFSRLAEEVRRTGLTASWIRCARRHAVSIYAPERMTGLLEPAPLLPKGVGSARHGDPDSAEWFILLDAEAYDRDLGLRVEPSSFIA